jgi:VanZ family protein
MAQHHARCESLAVGFPGCGAPWRSPCYSPLPFWMLSRKGDGLASSARGDFFRYWLPALAYVALIFTLSSIPGLRSPLRFPNSDKLMHVCEYGILGLVLVRALRTIPGVGGVMAASVLALVIGSTVGAADEIFQRGVPGRESTPYDWAADTLGLAIGQIGYVGFRRRRQGPSDGGERAAGKG